MGEIGDKVTLLDLARQSGADGSVDTKIVEIMNQTNQILWDMPWIECNNGTNHISTVRNGLPSGTWRKLNYPVATTKSATTQVSDSCGFLEAYTEVDKKLVELNNNSKSFRFNEEKAHIEGLSQDLADAIFYADTATDPEKILGLNNRYETISATDTNIGYNIISGSGASSDNTSVWLIGWGPDTIHGLYPKGLKAGLKVTDLGEQTKESANGLMQVLRSHFEWNVGLCVRDWRYAVRIANIDVSDLATTSDSTDTSCNLIKLMIQAIDKLPDETKGNLVFYANRVVHTALKLKMMDKSNVFLGMEDFTTGGGIIRKRLSFAGIPVARVDKLRKNEAVVS